MARLQPDKRWNYSVRPEPPEKVRVLFVGESPPASGRNFYAADSGLYRAIRAAFAGHVPGFAEGIANDAFLSAFRDAGCYLVDLCTEPVDRLPGRDRRLACESAEPGLAEVVDRLQPVSIITVVRSIQPNVTRALAMARWNGPRFDLPYPGRWVAHRRLFIASLRLALSVVLSA